MFLGSQISKISKNEIRNSSERKLKERTYCPIIESSFI
jgi:hypothetical protein